MKLIGLVIFLLLPFLAKTQDTLTYYYDAEWNVIKKKSKATFYRKLYQISDNTWEAKDFFKAGNLQMQGQYKTKLAKSRKGVFTYYYKNGQISSTGLYVDNSKQGEWLFYYENGKQSMVSTYDNGNCILEKRWDENGKMTVEEKPYDFAEINPEYPGGSAAMSKFIQDNFTYPDEAREKDEQGTIYIEFVVKNNGKIVDVKTVKGVSQSLDAEAERVVQAMPRWKPGEQAGKPVSVRYTIPFKCTLSDNDNKKKKKR